MLPLNSTLSWHCPSLGEHPGTKKVRCSQRNTLVAQRSLYCTRIRAQAPVMQAAQDVTTTPTTAAIISTKQTFEICCHQHLRTADKNRKLENWFIIIMKDRYSKLTRAVSVPRTTARHLAMAVLGNWNMPYNMLNTIMTDMNSHFVSKLFTSLSSTGGKHLPRLLSITIKLLAK